MERSPCLSCPFIDEDKNCERCSKCEKRLAYTMGHKMYQIDEVDDMPKKEEKTEEEIQKEIREIYKKDIAKKEIQEKRPVGRPTGSRNKERTLREINPRVQLRIQFVGIIGAEAQEVVADLKIIAKKEMRRVSEQALYFLRGAIENYKKKEKPDG